MIVTARYSSPCSDCDASADRPCLETCPTRQTAPLAVPSPRVPVDVGSPPWRLRVVPSLTVHHVPQAAPFPQSRLR
ncbi:hypothetical protein SAMN05192575_105262 [Nocardioides alpinus]|uniref:Uncharacterized protein n=1 Tax=Nocardioides alpinus TaxID=748909 RepID=A0A1I0ZHC3_9ACTN|nr:hypothetical protein SAMN05192575_105262 [Nocardioides alpinus]